MPAIKRPILTEKNKLIMPLWRESHISRAWARTYG